MRLYVWEAINGLWPRAHPVFIMEESMKKENKRVNKRRKEKTYTGELILKKSFHKRLIDFSISFLFSVEKNKLLNFTVKKTALQERKADKANLLFTQIQSCLFCCLLICLLYKSVVFRQSQIKCGSCAPEQQMVGWLKILSCTPQTQ